MSIREAMPNYDKLTTSDKLALLDEKWIDLSSKPADIPSLQSPQMELRELYQEYLENPGLGESWAEVKKELQKRCES